MVVIKGFIGYTNYAALAGGGIEGRAAVLAEI